MRIEIIFAGATELWRQTLELPEGTTVGEALDASDFARNYPEYVDPALAVGVYGERCAPERVLVNEDRIEIYRSLVFDPLESRRRRVQHKKHRKRS